MKARHRAALESLGVEIGTYHLGYDRQLLPTTDGVPKVWGTSLRHPKLALVVEHEADEYGGNWRWHIRPWAGSLEDLGTFRTLREALAVYALRLAERL